MESLNARESNPIKRYTVRSTSHSIPANALQSNAEACKLAGMNDYITKPVSAMVLREVVQKRMAVEFDEADSTTSKVCA